VIVFVDNDAILKLEAWDLLDLLVETLKVEKHNLRVLPTLIYKLNSRKIIDRYGETACEKIHVFINDLPLLEQNAELADSLPEVNGIDPGEKLLLAAAVGVDSFFLTTGDKNFLRALPKADGYEAILGNFRNRVICLEQILWLGSQSRSYIAIQENIKNNPGCDKAMLTIFGSSLNAPGDQIEKGFISYIDALQNETSGLLYAGAIPKTP
jgi:hypothetical protein